MVRASAMVSARPVAAAGSRRGFGTPAVSARASILSPIARAGTCGAAGSSSGSRHASTPAIAPATAAVASTTTKTVSLLLFAAFRFHEEFARERGGKTVDETLLDGRGRH